VNRLSIAMAVSSVLAGVVVSTQPARATICNITCTRGMDGNTTSSCFDIFSWESECAQAAADINHGDVACKYDWSYFGTCAAADRASPVDLVKGYLNDKIRRRHRDKP
jgi:hypothetical protein